MGRGKPKKAEASVAKSSSTAKERKPSKSAGRSKASKGPATSLQTLKNQKQDVVKKHLKADRTRKAYDAHVNRGREFLERQCKDTDELEESRRNLNPTQSSETADHTSSSDGMQVDSGILQQQPALPNPTHLGLILSLRSHSRRSQTSTHLRHLCCT